MKAIILAAGRGERMRPLTDTTPKPLLKIGKFSLLEHRLQQLKQAGISECVINTAYRGKQIRDAIGNGQRYGVSIAYSNEGDEALETAGGIIQALPLLGNTCFIVVNADIWTDYNFASLPQSPAKLAHLVMVNNPSHNQNGDFSLQNGLLSNSTNNRLTYSGIGVYQSQLFQGLAPGKRPLLPLLTEAIKANNISGEHYTGLWMDIGTPERLHQVQQDL